MQQQVTNNIEQEPNFADLNDMKEQAQNSKEQIELEQNEEQNQNLQQQEIENAQLIDNFAAQAQAFEQTQSDFADAFEFLFNMRTKQLEQFANLEPKFKNHKARVEQVREEAIDLLKMANKVGANAPQFIYNLAKFYGYSLDDYGKGAINEAQRRDAQSLVDMNDKIQKNKELRARALSLTATSGAQAPTPMSLEMLAQLSQEEFDAWYQANKSEFKRLMGR